MNDRDLRAAFDQLNADVAGSVQTEERLQQLTERRGMWVRPTVAAVAGAAAIAIVVGGVVLALRPAPDPVPPATGGPSSTDVTAGPTTLPPTTAVPTPTTLPPTTAVPTPTTLPPTTAVPTSTTLPPTTAVPTPTTLPLPAGTALVADPGASLTAYDGVVLVDADRVVGDGAGGVVVQRGDTISRVAADGSETLLLDPSTVVEGSFWAGRPRLDDVVFVDGAPQAVVVIDFSLASQEIWLLDLDSGATKSVYSTVSDEGRITRVSAAAGRMVLSVSTFERSSYFEYLDTAGRPIDVVGPYYTDPNGYAEAPLDVDQAVLSPDGATLVYLEIDVRTLDWEEWRSSGFLSVVDIVSWDLDDGTELSRLQIEFPDGSAPGRLDYDGDGVVLGRHWGIGANDLLAPLRIAPLGAGVVTELEVAGRPSLVK